MLYRYIFILVITFTSITLRGQSPCSTIHSFTISKTLPNPCEKVIVDEVFWNGTPGFPVTLNVSLDFGDGSPVQNNAYSGVASALFATVIHSYTTAGTYTVTLSLNNPGCQ